MIPTVQRMRRLGDFDPSERLFAQAMGLQAMGELAAAAEAYRAIPDLERVLERPVPRGRPLSRPDFLVIGTARSGTTWIKDVLKEHPQVAMALGEPRYFSAGLHRPPTGYLDELAAVAANKPDRLVAGEKSPEYIAMPDARIALCAALFPEVRLVCVIRDPVARGWSVIKHLRDGGLLNGRWSDPQAWTARGAGPKRGFPQLREVPLLRRHLEESRYERHLRRWAVHFPPERFLLIDFHRIATEPQAVHAELLAHLGVSARPMPPARETTADGPPPEVAAALEPYYAGERLDPAALLQSMAEARRLAEAGAPDPMQPEPPPDTPEALWTWLLRLMPQNAQAHASLAELLAQKGEPGALSHLAALARIRPSDPVIWRLLGLIALRSPGLARKLRPLRELAKGDPDNPQLRPLLVRLLEAWRSRPPPA